jgi:translation initiation factor IF-3
VCPGALCPNPSQGLCRRHEGAPKILPLTDHSPVPKKQVWAQPLARALSPNRPCLAATPCLPRALGAPAIYGPGRSLAARLAPPAGGAEFDAHRAYVVSSTTSPPGSASDPEADAGQEEQDISASDLRVNEDIRVREVRLIGPDGQNLGVVSTREALQIARQAGLDLVEVAPNVEPPVCRVLDYGKFLYEKAKKEREARKAQTKIEIKEIRLRPKTSDHHRSFKIRDARRWLTEGKKVRVRIRFRGREITYPEIALEDLRAVAADLADVASIEQAPMMEGRTMLMTLAPGKPAKAAS